MPRIQRGIQAIRTSGRLRQVAWGAFDQALSSLTNFLLSVFVARSVDVDEFGAFSIAFATYLVFLSVSRALATEPLTIRYSGSNVNDWRLATRGSTGTAVLVGLLAGGVLAIAGYALGGSVGSAVAVVGIGLMPLLVQDAWRYAFFAARRGRSAFANDLIWTIALVPAVILISLNGHGSTELWIAAWAVAGGAGAVFGIWQAKLLPDPMLTASWLREHRGLTPRLVTESLILVGSGYVTLFAVSITSGLRAVAALRASQVLMNAIHIATYGVQLFAIPEAVTLGRQSLARLRQFALLVSGGLFFIALAWGGLLLALPPGIGEALLGETWASAQTVILPIAIMNAALGAAVGPFVGLRALALVRESLRGRTVTSFLQLIAGVAGARLADASGAAWGMAIGCWVGTLMWWYEFLGGVRRHAHLQPDIDTAAAFDLGEPEAVPTIEEVGG